MEETNVATEKTLLACACPFICLNRSAQWLSRCFQKLWPNHFLKGLWRIQFDLEFSQHGLSCTAFNSFDLSRVRLVLLYLWNFACPGETSLLPRFWECCFVINFCYIYLIICIFCLAFFTLTQVAFEWVSPLRALALLLFASVSFEMIHKNTHFTLAFHSPFSSYPVFMSF